MARSASRPSVVVFVSGGQVKKVAATSGISVAVVDYDTDGCDGEGYQNFYHVKINNRDSWDQTAMAWVDEPEIVKIGELDGGMVKILQRFCNKIGLRMRGLPKG